jgi:3-carboxy-cis,cis-muconate cycloisomerase
MFDVEVALAEAGAHAGIVPAAAARSIALAAAVEAVDVGEIVRGARETGTPAIAFVEALRRRVRDVDASAAVYVHWGATSQDVTDTALLVLLARARDAVARDVIRVDAALRSLSDVHASTLMLGRTLLQPAAPITFGLKSAQWCAAVSSSAGRMFETWRDALAVQLGGAVGTRAAFGAHASAIVKAAAARLALPAAPPWHTNRDRLGALVAAFGIHVAALAKVARDVSLLMQPEVGEASERGGGSSSMPHKRNPSACAVVLAAATRMPGLVSAFLTGMVQEHERAVGGWHAEWPTIAAAVQTTGAAAAAAASLLEGLQVDAGRMRANLEATGGVIFAERALNLLAPAIGREAAHALVERAIQESRAKRIPFRDALAAQPDASAALPGPELQEIDRPETYLGEAEAIRRELLSVTPPRAVE